MKTGETIGERRARDDWSHLDVWRIAPREGAFAFGPVTLSPRLNANARAFLAALAPTPKHGMLWSDAEAEGFMGAQISREAARVVRHINEPWRTAVRERANSDRYVAPLVRSVPMHGKGTPMCICINSGLGWAEAFIAAIEGGITSDEVKRLNQITGLKFTKTALRKPTGLKIHYDSSRDIYVNWPGRTEDHPLHRALFAISLINGDTPFDWGDMQLTFGWGWLQDKKRYAEACEQYLGLSAMKRLGFKRKVTTSWEQHNA